MPVKIFFLLTIWISILFFLSNCAYVVPKKFEGTNFIVKKIGSDLIKKKINGKQDIN